MVIDWRDTDIHTLRKDTTGRKSRLFTRPRAISGHGGMILNQRISRCSRDQRSWPSGACQAGRLPGMTRAEFGYPKGNANH